MSDQKVEYTLSLKDLLTGKVKLADGAIQHMEGSLHEAAFSAKAFAMEMIGAIGITVALAKAFQFIEHGHEAWEKLEFANSQLEAGLTSTGHAAGLTFEMLDEMSTRMAHNLKFTKSEIAEMQSQLLTFPKVTQDVFEQASTAVLDLATRTHKGTNEVAVMVGKALQDPERGITALRRVGVNFTDTQQEAIKKMVETGNVAKAQLAILQELNTEFGGSAQAAAAADVGFRYNKTMEELSLTIGKVADQLQEALLPIFEALVDGVKDAVDWMIRNKDILEAIGIGALVAASAWGIYLLAVNAATIGTNIWTIAQWALNVAMNANPIGLLIIGIGALVAYLVYAYKHFAKFRAVLWGVWETVKEFGRIVGDIFMGLWHIIHGVFTLSPSEIKLGGQQSVDAMFNSGKRLGNAFKKGYEEGMADFEKSQKEDKEPGAPKTVTKKAAKGEAGKDGKSESAKGTGTKNVVINVTINGGLVKDINMKVVNLKEGAGKIREEVTKALLSAVNDSQIVAE